MWPGILVQKITTRQPTDDMIEVAIVAMEEALRADGETLPVSTVPLQRDPMVLGGERVGDPETSPGQPRREEAATPVTLDPPVPGA